MSGRSFKQVRRDAEQMLHRQGTITGGNPVNVIVDKTGADRETVRNALEDLERRGKIVIARKNGMVESIAHTRPRGYIDRTEMSPGAKREQTFAKGVPAYLRDDQCGPVTVRLRPAVCTDQSNREESEVSTTSGSCERAKKRAMHEHLTDALILLRNMANEDGVCADSGAPKVLEELGGLSRGMSTKIAKYLAGMELCRSEMIGYQQWSYRVTTSVECVTAEMVAKYEASMKCSTAQRPDTPVKAVPSSVDDLQLKLAGIIEQKEAEVERLSRGIQMLDTQLQEALASVEAANERTRELEQRIKELEAEKAQTPQVSPRVAEILKRYDM